AGSGLLSADLALASRIHRADTVIAESAGPSDFFGDLRLRLGISGALLLDEDGRAAGGIEGTIGATLFDRVSWMNRVGLFFGGIDDPAPDVLSRERQLVRIESLLGWRFFVDLFGFTTLYIVPAGGVSVGYETLSQRG